MSVCPNCGATLASSLVCEACDALQEVEGTDPWSAFGLPLAYTLDAKALKKRLLTLQRLMHPDFFSGAEAGVRERAERNTAELNAAHRVLADEVRRADAIVRTLGGPDEEAERQMPQAFLMEVLEWNETLEEAKDAAPDSPAHAALAPLAAQLKAERAEALERIGALLEPLPDSPLPDSPLPDSGGAPALTEARRELNAVRYLDRTLGTLAELQLHAAQSGR